MAPDIAVNPASLKNTRSLRGCPVCSGEECEVLHAQKFVLPEGHPLSDGYDVVVCEKCGFVYADTGVSQQDYDVFYARHSKYEHAATSTGGGGSPEDGKRLKATAACIAEAIPDRQARLLDIGCAGGGLLKELSAMGYSQLCGLDPSTACVEATKSACSAEAFAGSLASLPADLGTFDGIVLSHVLEHVQDLSQSLQSLEPLVRPGGLVYVEVPDATRYAECLLAPFQDFNTEHINHFSARSLENVFALRNWRQTSGGSKTIEAAPGMPYPALFGLFAKAPASAEAAAWRADTALRKRIADYITQSREMIRRIDRQMAQVLAENTEVIVWGTGQLAMKLLGETCLGQARIVAFVDGNPINHGKILKGSPILAPSQVRGSSAPIVVTSVIQSRAISNAITRLNLRNPLILLGS